MSDADKHRARIFLHRGQLAQAKAAYEQAVADDRLAHDQRALSDSLGNLGNVCALSGELDRAETCYREVLTIQRTEQNQQAIAHTLVNLGNLHVGAGHPEKARPYYLEALDRRAYNGKIMDAHTLDLLEFPKIRDLLAGPARVSP